MNEKILLAIKLHAEGNIAKAKTNVEVFLNNSIGVADHGDIVKTIMEQIKVINDNEDIIETIYKHFPVSKNKIN